MTEIVYEYEGAIFELTGDEILVGFNAPFDQPDASIRALQTAVAMQTKFNLLRRELNQGVRTGVGLGIGIDQGEVVLGNVGAETRMTFRMVGDAVNTAHRLVDIAVDGQIVVSASVYEDIKKREAAQLEEIKLQLMGPISIKGKDAPEVLYHVRIPADL
jgi:adenylate cyclase